MAFDQSFSVEDLVDLEKILVETSQAGRDDSRLLFGMRGWLLKHHDLVNGSRLIRFVRQEKQTAVLGAVIDSVIEINPRSVLKAVRRYCRKLNKPEFLFRRIGRSPTESELNQEECLSVWKRWNLISREMSTMGEAILEKPYVLRNNPNLALRALFGAGTRAEIFSYFIKNKEGNALEISFALGQSYQPVYSELMALCKIGLGKVTKVGAERIFQVPYPFLKVLLNLFAGNSAPQPRPF